MIKMIVIMALALMALIALPLVVGILAAIWPIALSIFVVLFPVLVIGAIIGYCFKKRKE